MQTFNNPFNSLPHNPDFLTTLKRKPFENMGKGENAGDQCFLPFQTQISIS